MRYAIMGSNGMVGSAFRRALPEHETLYDARLAGAPHWDFRDPVECDYLLEDENIDVLFLCAARVGGIQRNIAEPASMLYDNLMIQANAIEAARQHGVKLVVFFGSSCIYPRAGITAQAAWREDDLGKGALEPTNEPYAIAKIAGIKMLEAYERQYGMKSLILMPCNLYGPGDHYEPERSHMVPALIRRFHDAKIAGDRSVTVWGSGRPRRELMHVDDLASAALHLIERGCTGMYNVGPGVDQSVSEIAESICSAVGLNVNATIVHFDRSKPDGVQSKLLDVSKLRATGWNGCRALTDGLRDAYRAYLETLA